MPAIFKTAAPYQGDVLSLPFYQTIMGFRVLSHSDTPAPHPTAILTRDGIQFGLAENGGDLGKNGCFFEVDNVEKPSPNSRPTAWAKTNPTSASTNMALPPTKSSSSSPPTASATASANGKSKQRFTGAKLAFHP